METERANFAEERANLLQQIQELSSKHHSQTKSYSDALLTSSDDWPPLSNPTTTRKISPHQSVTASNLSTPRKSSSPQPVTSTTLSASTKSSPQTITTTCTSTAVPCRNSFAVLTDEVSDSNSTSAESTRTVINPHVKSSKRKSSQSVRNSRSHHGKTVRQPKTARPKSTPRPQVVLLGDSISKRIDGQRLLKKGNVINFSKGGRRIENIKEDIISNTSTVSKADSMIIHIGTNNLQRDSIDIFTNKLHELEDTVKCHMNRNCEVAFSSILRRKDRLDSKVDEVNQLISDMCDNNKWTFIDNKAVTASLLSDNVHPDDRGMSFLARNFQDFLRCVHPFIFPKTIYPAWLTCLMT